MAKFEIVGLDTNEAFEFGVWSEGRLIGHGKLIDQTESIEWICRPKPLVKTVNGTVDDPEAFDKAIVNLVLQLSAYEFEELES